MLVGKGGAGRYERTDGRVTDRNGSRQRLLATEAGDIELRIPKLRTRGHRRSSPDGTAMTPAAPVHYRLG